MAGVLSAVSSDGVDKLNHKWVVLLLLLLSLAAFIIPLHPTFNEENKRSPSPSFQSSLRPKTALPLTLAISCWCPQSFTHSMVKYVDSYCRSALASVLDGNNDTTSIYEFDVNRYPKKENRESLAVSRKHTFEKIRREKENNAERESIKTRLQSLVAFQTPIMLLVIAMSLVVPQLVCSFLSECCSPFNVAQTLASASRASTMDADSQTQAYRDISSSLINNCPKTASVVYLVKKVLSVLVVICLLLVVTQHILPEIQDIQQSRLDTSVQAQLSNYDSNKMGENNNIPDKNQHQNSRPITTHDLFQYPRNVFECSFDIRQLSMMHSYSVQCTVSAIEESDNTPQPGAAPHHGAETTSKEESLLGFEGLVFQVVTVLLAVLAVANVFSLWGWLWKLLSISARKSVRLSGNAGMDTVFLVQMARIYCGADVAHRLALASSGDDNKIELD